MLTELLFAEDGLVMGGLLFGDATYMPRGQILQMPILTSGSHMVCDAKLNPQELFTNDSLSVIISSFDISIFIIGIPSLRIDLDYICYL